MSETQRPECPECGENVDLQIREGEDGEEEASYVHCGHYWTFAPEQPTANEARDRSVDTETSDNDGEGE